MWGASARFWGQNLASKSLIWSKSAYGEKTPFAQIRKSSKHFLVLRFFKSDNGFQRTATYVIG